MIDFPYMGPHPPAASLWISLSDTPPGVRFAYSTTQECILGAVASIVQKWRLATPRRAAIREKGAREMVAVPSGSSTLLESVRETLRTLNLGPQHAAMVCSAEMLARTIDSMDREERVRMAAQTVPQLMKVLEQLAATAGPGAPRGLTDAGLRLLLGEEDADGRPA